MEKSTSADKIKYFGYINERNEQRLLLIATLNNSLEKRGFGISIRKVDRNSSLVVPSTARLHRGKQIIKTMESKNKDRK